MAFGSRSNNNGSGRVFGQAMKKSSKGGSSSSNYQRQFGGGKGTHSRLASSADESQLSEDQLRAQMRAKMRRIRQAQGEELDVKFGYAPFNHKTATTPNETRRGWLFNMLPTVRLLFRKMRNHKS